MALSVSQESSHSDVLDPATGAVTGSFPLVDIEGYVTQESNGNLLYSADGYVDHLGPTGTVLGRFGASQTDGQRGPHRRGDPVLLPGPGVSPTAGRHDLHHRPATGPSRPPSPTGFLQGVTTPRRPTRLRRGLGTPPWWGRPSTSRAARPFNSAGDYIASFPLATLQTYLGAIQPPLNSLGWGASVTTPATGNYFAPGTTPSVTATFDPWWASVASHVQLSYSVEDTAARSTAGTLPAPTVVPLPTTAAALASVPLTLPAADTAPGPYEVQATLSTPPPARPPPSAPPACPTPWGPPGTA